MAISFTMIPNEPMTDKQLSLRAKGVFACITSFAGLPGFCLSIQRLKRSCSDSTYAIRSALRELKSRGYLAHTFSTDARGAFCHAYTLYDSPLSLPSSVPQFRQQDERANGDVQLVRQTKGNFTKIPSEILRSCEFSLQVKALYAIMKHLIDIPSFTFRVRALSNCCQERTKALRAAWHKLKLSGLLKQERHPTGEHNAFEYVYELLEAPDLERPYFANCRRDGSATFTRTIRQYLSKAHQALRSIGRKQKTAPSPAAPQQTAAFDYNQIALEHGTVFAELLQKAVDTIRHGKYFYDDGEKLRRADRDAAAAKLSPDLIRRFAGRIKMPDHVRAPLPYLTASLYRFIANGNDEQVGQADPPLSFYEVEDMVQHIVRRVAQKRESHSFISDRDLRLDAAYHAMAAGSRDEYEAQIRTIFDDWKNA